MSINPFLTSAIAACAITLAGCQTLMPKQTEINTTLINQEPLLPNKLNSFNINGKIGMTNSITNQAGSVFYVWAQDDERFTIELQGPLGIGFTRIQYNGQQATLQSGNIGTISANNPDDLLYQATGWEAPISQLPYWISGSPAPTDTSQKLDNQRRLIEAINGKWTASFAYADDAVLPKKIISRHSNGSKVIMIIKHQKRPN